MTWQPIGTAPRDGSWMLLTGGDIDYGWYWDTKPRVVSGFYIGEDDEHHAFWQFAYYDSGYYGAYENPTHWMPLPDAPV